MVLREAAQSEPIHFSISGEGDVPTERKREREREREREGMSRHGARREKPVGKNAEAFSNPRRTIRGSSFASVSDGGRCRIRVRVILLLARAFRISRG